MRRPPPLSEFPRFPVAGGVALLAIGVTLVAWFGEGRVKALLQDEHVLQGQVWRLVTSILPHGDVFHLLFNLMWLWTLGTLIEEMLGHVRTFALIVLLALGSMGAQYALGNSLAGGLSGVVYGMWGMCFVLTGRDARFRDATDANTNQMMVAWFFFCIVLTWLGVWRVANVAHGAGAVLGVVVGLAIGVRPRAAWWVLTLLLTGGTVFAAVRLREWVNFSHNSQAEFLLGNDAAIAGRLAEAEKWYRRALRVDPTYHRSWYNLALVYQQTGRHAEAVPLVRRARELDPGQSLYQGLEDELSAYVDAATRPAGALP